LTKDLQETFQNHEQHKRIIFDDIFFINGKDENDPEINRLKTKLVEVAFRQKSWGKRMPMECAYVVHDFETFLEGLWSTFCSGQYDLSVNEKKINRSWLTKEHNPRREKK
jgi:hypothetical protein